MPSYEKDGLKSKNAIKQSCLKIQFYLTESIFENFEIRPIIHPSFEPLASASVMQISSIVAFMSTYFKEPCLSADAIAK